MIHDKVLSRIENEFIFCIKLYLFVIAHCLDGLTPIQYEIVAGTVQYTHLFVLFLLRIHIYLLTHKHELHICRSTQHPLARCSRGGETYKK
jgi:hypothetical protein